MIVRIYRDERYPDFSLGETVGALRNVPEVIVRRWRKAIKAYEKAQKEMQAQFERMAP